MAACPDADVERKIVRTALHIVADMLYTDRRGVIDDGARQQLWVVLTDELDKYTGSRQAVGWRLAGQLCALLGFHRDLVERAEQELSSFRNLAKPSGWFKKNAKREYEEQVQFRLCSIRDLTPHCDSCTPVPPRFPPFGDVAGGVRVVYPRLFSQVAVSVLISRATHWRFSLSMQNIPQWKFLLPWAKRHVQ
jgi:hypothetical protein